MIDRFLGLLNTLDRDIVFVYLRKAKGIENDIKIGGNALFQFFQPVAQPFTLLNKCGVYPPADILVGMFGQDIENGFEYTLWCRYITTEGEDIIDADDVRRYVPDRFIGITVAVCQQQNIVKVGQVVLAVIEDLQPLLLDEV